MNKLILLFAIITLSVNSWCACVTHSSNTSCAGCATDRCYIGQYNGRYVIGYGSSSYVGVICTRQNTPFLNPSCSISDNKIYCSYLTCDTQAEADSAHCAFNPSDPNCIQTIDTLLYACSMFEQDGKWYAGIYKLNCKAQNGAITECNGKQNVNINTDGTRVRQYEGTCEENGFNNGIFGGGTPQDSLPNGANADCFAVVGSKCHMRDKVSGNTFTCDCDGSCNVAIQNLMAGNANCTNPYPQPNSSGTDVNLSSFNESMSSAQSSPSSSASSSPSSSAESSESGSGGASSDFEYDYTQVLDDIRANTQYTGSQVSKLNDKADLSNRYLSEIADKDWSPTINVAAPNVNVQVNGDTAKSPHAILELLNGKLNGGEGSESDTAGTGAQINGLLSGIDSMVNEGVPDMTDSIPNKVSGYYNSFQAFKDSLNNSAMEDSIARWNGLITNNGVITGNGSDNCPSILRENVTYEFPLPTSTISVNAGSLGEYICKPISPFNMTLWAFARVIIRAMVAIGCMFWLYKAVLGIDGGSNDED